MILKMLEEVLSSLGEETLHPLIVAIGPNSSRLYYCYVVLERKIGWNVYLERHGRGGYNQSDQVDAALFVGLIELLRQSNSWTHESDSHISGKEVCLCYSGIPVDLL